MDWLRSDDTVWDFNLGILNFNPIRCQVLVLARYKTDVYSQQTALKSDEEWESWLATDPLKPNPEFSSQINLLVGARAPVGPMEPAAVSYLPFSMSTFRTLINVFRIHGTIARTINRSTDCAFIRKFCPSGPYQPHSIVYNCRSSASWDDDLAMSVTFCPSSLTSHVVIYGCSEDISEQIVRRLSNSDLLEFHPMVPVTLFAELERNRLDKLVNEKITALIQRIVNMTDSAYLTVGKDSRAATSVALSITDCLEMGELKNGLQGFKRKILDMIQHTEELEGDVFNQSKRPNSWAVLSEKQLDGLRDSGLKIKDRLKHLVDEFEMHIQKCETVINGVSLASQLEWNQIGRKDTFTNLEIAQNGLQVAKTTQRDSELMKSIALLTMVFLPATFVATLFSMGIFEWSGEHGEIITVSPYIWLYVVVTVAITSLTFGTWRLMIVRRTHRNGDVEKRIPPRFN
ncbi:hypothetical protein GGR58DRAFT_468104 [Xylaria digitata]|nr:hypothetical protein GGR58DRAFT_468104 [Xylaria digitata]